MNELNSLERFWVEQLGLCGCSGYSEKHVEDVFSRLYCAHVNDESFYYDYSNEKIAAIEELVLMIFDKVGLTEHGSSVRGSWLTPKGVVAYENYFLK